MTPEAAARIYTSLRDVLLHEHRGVFEDAEADPRLADATGSVFAAIDAALDREAQYKAFAAALRDVENATAARRKRLETAIDNIRAGIANAMSELGDKTMQRPAATITLAKAKPSAIIMDDDAIPPRFKVPQPPPPPKTDKAAVLEALQEGQIVPGATLSNGAPTLTIRRS